MATCERPAQRRGVAPVTHRRTLSESRAVKIRGSEEAALSGHRPLFRLINRVPRLAMDLERCGEYPLPKDVVGTHPN